MVILPSVAPVFPIGLMLCAKSSTEECTVRDRAELLREAKEKIVSWVQSCLVSFQFVPLKTVFPFSFPERSKEHGIGFREDGR